VIVKIDNPKGSYYGGRTAAPVTRTMLQQSLASRRVAIDRGRLAPPEVLAEPDPASPAAGSPTRKPVVVLSWPYQKSDSVTSPVPVPSVTGRSVREAALALHRRGLRMNLHGLGRVVRTAPAAGESAPQGVSVTVWAE
jgi:hypothetical protein